MRLHCLPFSVPFASELPVRRWNFTIRFGIAEEKTRTNKSLIWLPIVMLWFVASHASALSAHQSSYASDLQTIATWVTGLQYANPTAPGYGAVRVHDTVSVVGPTGKQYYTVSPYFGNLSMIGLLQTSFPTRLQTAERWIRWYSNHLTPTSAADGVPYTHFYLADGSGETTCVTPGNPALCKYNDATDSAAATFFSLLWAYHQAGGSNAFFTENSRKSQLEQLAQVLLALQQPDGLAWAKATYKVKYLEDNCEVFHGLRALAQIEMTIYHDSVKATSYTRAASRVQQGILTDLYVSRNSLYSPARFENGTVQSTNITIWYPDMQSQFWPHLFGVVSPSDARSRAILNALNSTWNGKPQPDWTTTPDKVNGGFLSADVAFGALLAGDRPHIVTYLASVKALKYPDDPQKPRFVWPFTVGDAGWLLQILAQMH